MSKVEFSGTMQPGGSDEKITIHRNPDCSNSQGGGCRHAGQGDLSQARHLRRHYYNWKSKYGGMSASDLKRIKELESENAKLKRMYADMALENRAMKDLIEKKL
jgi:hypothetical protein